MSGLSQLREQAAMLGVEVARAAQHGTLALYADRSIQDEEHLTGALCGQMAARWSRQERGLRIDIAVVHKVKEEPRLGADLMIAFASGIEEWPLRTRLLVQAKRAEPGARMDAREWRRMAGQIDAMLKAATESFVMAYSRAEGISVFPALSVAACASRDLFDLDWYPFPAFIEGVCCGFVGERGASWPPGLDDGGRWGARHELDIVIAASHGEADPGRGAPVDSPLQGVQGSMS